MNSSFHTVFIHCSLIVKCHLNVNTVYSLGNDGINNYIYIYLITVLHNISKMEWQIIVYGCEGGATDVTAK